MHGVYFFSLSLVTIFWDSNFFKACPEIEGLDLKNFEISLLFFFWAKHSTYLTYFSNNLLIEY